MLPAMGDPEAAKKEAATVAMSELIVPGTLGIVTDVAGLSGHPCDLHPTNARFGYFWSVLGFLDHHHRRNSPSRS